MTNTISQRNIILYVDDDPDDLNLINTAFLKYFPSVDLVSVSSGMEALTYLRNLSPLDPVPCLIILDINMPGMNGHETLKQIRMMKRYSRVPVVFFTTSSHPHDRHFAETNNVGFVTKPITADQLEKIVDQFIDHCAAEVQKNIRQQRS